MKMLLTGMILLAFSCIPKEPAPKEDPNLVLQNDLPEMLRENSGMIAYNDLIWFINDSGNDSAMYGYDRQQNKVVRTVHVKNARNTDWEEITQNDQYIFIGDFGNNASGNRTDLRIYMIKKSDVGDNDTVQPYGVINFSYEDQSDFTPQLPNNTDFDCEAFIATDNSIILFTKHWMDSKTKVYTLAAIPGTQVAGYLAEWNVNGLVTGSTWSANDDKLYLIGYSGVVLPILWEISGFDPENAHFTNNKRTDFGLSYTQAEGICILDNGTLLVSSEEFTLINPGAPARLYELRR